MKYVVLCVLFVICIGNVNAEAIWDPNFYYGLQYWLTAQEYASWGPVPLGTVTVMDTLGSTCARMHVNGAPSCVRLVTTTKDILYPGDIVRINFYNTDMYAGGIELCVGDFWDNTGASGQFTTWSGGPGYHQLQITCNRTYSKGTAIQIKLVVWPGNITAWIMQASASVEENSSSNNVINTNNLTIQTPNPTNKDVRLTFSVDKQSKTTIKIYNTNGQLIKDFNKGILNPGQYDLIWNRTDNSGRMVPNGIYFYKLELDDKVYTSKSLIMQ
ncbi:MAG: T9SS type A sorting domain-containing protein [Candidatus Latescibacteria bacterium]|nr:T9SS type A sorting domain-containing protein [Candidatus Latescibacterota bacterium]